MSDETFAEETAREALEDDLPLEDLGWAEEIVLNAAQRAFPMAVNDELYDLGISTDDVRTCVGKLVESGKLVEEAGGWVFVDGADAAEPLVPDDGPLDGYDDEPDGETAEAPTGDVPAVRPDGGQPGAAAEETRYEAAIAVKLSFGAYTDEKAVYLARQVAALIVPLLDSQLTEVEVFVALETVKAYDKPRDVEV